MWERQQGKGFSAGGSVNMDYGILVRSDGLKIKCLNRFVSYKNTVLASQDIN